ncbi:MAG: hypothetical protein AAB487_01665 [Patescibacteria group bacterium]
MHNVKIKKSSSPSGRGCPLDRRGKIIFKNDLSPTLSLSRRGGIKKKNKIQTDDYNFAF